MRLGAVYAGFVLAAWAAPLSAQPTLDPQCASGTPYFQDACQKTTDLFKFMAPQLGAIMAGGNATLGHGAPRARLGRLTVELRLNVLAGGVPQLDRIPIDTGPARRDTFRITALPLPLPLADAALGLFPGVATPHGRLGAVDLLLAASYLPAVSTASVELTLPDGSLEIGYGARVGLLEERGRWPGVTATFFRRELPTIDIIGISGEDRVEVRSLSVSTMAWRVVASRRLGAYALAAGGGGDRYVSGTNIFVTLNRPPCAPPGCSGAPFPDGFTQTMTRASFFFDVDRRLGPVRLAAELGRVGGGRITTYNVFTGQQPADSRWYGSLGLRLDR